MRQATLKLKSYAPNINIVNNNDINRQILRTMLYTLGGLAMCYVFLLGSMIFNIIERKSVETEARALSNEVGSLELQYLSLSSKVDLDFAKSLGFKETSNKTFATRKALGSIKFVQNDI